jgi:uncharacterized Zn-binding protein involved in type VI secretion
MKPVCFGDPTSSGGLVIECQLAGTHEIKGKTVAVLGDKATCPLHLGIYAFVEGHPHRRMNGKLVVLDGHRLACGCHGVATHAVSVRIN